MSDRFQKTVWTGLVLVLVAIPVAYLVSESRPKAPPLPVLGQVTPFALTNQLGQAVTADSLRGHVVVADVIFSRCPTQCHLLSQRLGRLQAKLPSGVRLLSLTADPGFDTPAVLARYAQRHGADAGKWWFLTGPKAEVYRLAQQDLRFSVLESAEPEKAKLEDLFIHSADFAVLDRKGRLRAVVHSDEAGGEEKLAALVGQLLREPRP